MRGKDRLEDEDVISRAEARVAGMPWGSDLVAYLVQLLALIKPICVLLFGSAARGDWDAYSDVDVLVVSDDLPEDFFEAQRIVYEPRRGRVQPYGYTSRRVEEMVKEDNSFLRNVLADAIPLIGEGYYSKLKAFLQESSRIGGVSKEPHAPQI